MILYDIEVTPTKHFCVESIFFAISPSIAKVNIGQLYSTSVTFYREYAVIVRGNTNININITQYLYQRELEDLFNVIYLLGYRNLFNMKHAARLYCEVIRLPDDVFGERKPPPVPQKPFIHVRAEVFMVLCKSKSALGWGENSSVCS